ncbi:GspE/PulE family protein [Ideonella paludis]|uniref:Type II/IV secretion system protein n=1 Tax=Ideonella paludis TaxID=1233411 RepID=A0ABS5E320_9BURK|nr:GspE/PulE family protein [Ideonella paludis]MBQ0937812.1 type II/IV secretion system protein [Ideonella paludis]
MSRIDHRFIELCRNDGLINDMEAQLLGQQFRAGIDLEPLFLKGGFVTEERLYRKIAEFLALRYVEPAELQFQRELQELLPAELQLQLNFTPLSKGAGFIEVVAGSLDFEAIEQAVFKRLSYRTRIHLCAPAVMRNSLRRSFSNAEAAFAAEVQRLTKLQGKTGTFDQFSTLLLRFAVAERATDIHIAPFEGALQIYFRVDGVMRPVMALAPWFSRYISFLKVLSEMDISEQRMPQDGSFSVEINGVPYTIRVSTIVTGLGERIAMRLLCESSEVPDVVALGYTQQAADLLNEVANQPNGLIVVTGPTGSGKSSTLHAMIKMTDLIGRNVLTVEDPVEYLLPLAGQTEVNKKAGYDFQRALRHFLRHDPDVILLGEMRDPETAKAAVDAAATGHLVLSTLHVTSTSGVPNRLVSMGLHPVSLAENLRCVISQRLVRRLCPHCRRFELLPPDDCRRLGLEQGQGGRRVGCEQCRGTGYLGRLPVYEILRVSPQIRNLVQAEASADAIRDEMVRGGFATMHDCARDQVLAGEVDADEVERVLGARW